MIAIKNNHDLRVAYGIMKSFEKDSYLICRDYKRSIRDYHKRNAETDRHIVKDYGIDGYVVLIELPEWIDSENEATEYFEAREYIEPYYTYYDCTGRPFTGWYKVFKRHGRWMVYHRVAFDV